MSLPNTTVWEQNVRALTVQAGQAAELGRWDQVEECFRQRGEQLQNRQISASLATDLAVIDRMIESRIVMARSAVQSQLIETAKIRQNLQGLRPWQALGGIESTFMDRRA